MLAQYNWTKVRSRKSPNGLVHGHPISFSTFSFVPAIRFIFEYPFYGNQHIARVHFLLPVTWKLAPAMVKDGPGSGSYCVKGKVKCREPENKDASSHSVRVKNGRILRVKRPVLLVYVLTDRVHTSNWLTMSCNLHLKKVKWRKKNLRKVLCVCHLMRFGSISLKLVWVICFLPWSQSISASVQKLIEPKSNGWVTFDMKLHHSTARLALSFDRLSIFTSSKVH